MKKVKVTNHAKKRIIERAGINKRSVIKSAERAFTCGLEHSDLTGILKKYIDKIYLKEKKANNIRIYGDKVYLFYDKTLITVLNLTTKLSKIANKLSKRKDFSETNLSREMETNV